MGEASRDGGGQQRRDGHRRMNLERNIERTSAGSSLIDVLDRVLDKGIVIDAWVRVSLVGIDLITVSARVVVASIATYLQFSDAVVGLATDGRSSDRLALPSSAWTAPVRMSALTTVPSSRPGHLRRRTLRSGGTALGA
jgi:hypothetical protein